MAEEERGRLFSIGEDGSESLPFCIRKDKIIFGRSDHCDVRIYVDGVAPEHCAVVFDREGRGSLKLLKKCGLTFLNGEQVIRQVRLYHKDIITIVKRKFKFCYPSLSRYVERSYLSTDFIDNKVCRLTDYNPDAIFSREQKISCRKRVTFGPRLSPEEFDKNLPPASPLRRGSLPEKLTKINPSSIYDTAGIHLKTNVSSIANSINNVRKLSVAKNLVKSNASLLKQPTLNNALIDQTSVHPKHILKSKKVFPKIVKTHSLDKKLNIKKKARKFVCGSLQKKYMKKEKSKNNSLLHLKEASDKNCERDPECYKEHLPSFGLYNYKEPDSSNSEVDLNIKKSIGNNVTNIGCNFHKFTGNKNDENENRCNEVLSSESSLTADENDLSEAKKQKIYKSLKNKQSTMKSLPCDSNMLSTLNINASSDMYIDAVKKFALTISMMNAFEMYNKIMENICNYSPNCPGTSFQSYKGLICDQKSSVDEDEKEMNNVAKFAHFNHIVENFFANYPGNAVIEKESCAFTNNNNNLNVELSSSSSSQNIQRSNVAFGVKIPHNVIDITSSADEDDESVCAKKNDSHNTLSKFDKYCSEYKHSCCHQDSSKASVVESRRNIDSPSTSYNSLTSGGCSCLPFYLMKNLSIQEFHNYNGDFDEQCVKTKKNIPDVCLAYQNVHNSFNPDFSLKQKCVHLIRKSLSPKCLNKSKRKSSGSFSALKSKSFSLKSNNRHLHSRDHAILKDKQKRASLVIKKYRKPSLRKIKTSMNGNESKSNSHTVYQNVKFCKELNINDPDEECVFVKPKIMHKQKISKNKIGSELIVKRVTRSTVAKNETEDLSNLTNNTSSVQKISKTRSSVKRRQIKKSKDMFVQEMDKQQQVQEEINKHQVQGKCKNGWLRTRKIIAANPNEKNETRKNKVKKCKEHQATNKSDKSRKRNVKLSLNREKPKLINILKENYDDILTTGNESGKNKCKISKKRKITNKSDKSMKRNIKLSVNRESHKIIPILKENYDDISITENETRKNKAKKCKEHQATNKSDESRKRNVKLSLNREKPKLINISKENYDDILTTGNENGKNKCKISKKRKITNKSDKSTKRNIKLSLNRESHKIIPILKENYDDISITGENVCFQRKKKCKLNKELPVQRITRSMLKKENDKKQLKIFN